MPNKQYQIDLSVADRIYLQTIIEKGSGRAREIRRAQTLLLADEKKQDQAIANFLPVNPNTVSATRQRYCEIGLPAALKEQSRPGTPRKLDGKQAALLVALAWSEAPQGRSQWTLQVLADKLVELPGGVTDGISDETVRRTLKKMLSNPG